VEDHELALLDQRLEGLAEPAIRREAALRELEGRPPEEACALLARAFARPELETLGRALRDVLSRGGAARPLDAGLRAALHRAAEARGDAFVARLLATAEAEQTLEDPQRALPRDVADLPLGVRRAVAKGFDRARLERLLLDPDPLVVSHLLENPRITEDDVVRIAARRPIAGATLAAIHRSRRFGARPRVRRALAGNPWCPTEVALAALSELPALALREIARDETLHTEVRRHADEELARRSGR
jgi:hypothetical protein